MFLAIVTHTPTWVWGLLAALTVLGLSQARDRTLSRTRITVLPLLMLALSLSGVLSAFGAQGLALLSWGAGLLAAQGLAPRLIGVRGAQWRPDTARLHVPGSWWPLSLILGLFAVKYVAGASLALHPQWATEPAFASACSAAYGLFSGLFVARALQLRRLTDSSGSLQVA